MISFIYTMTTRALAAVVKFLAPLPGTKLLTIEYCLTNVTKHFIILFCFVSLLFFFFLFNWVASVGESAFRNFLYFIQSLILYRPDPKIERTFHLRKKKQRIEEQRHEARRNSSMVGEERRTLRDFITPESKGSPQAQLGLLWMPITSSSS